MSLDPIQAAKAVTELDAEINAVFNDSEPLIARVEECLDPSQTAPDALRADVALFRSRANGLAAKLLRVGDIPGATTLAARVASLVDEADVMAEAIGLGAEFEPPAGAAEMSIALERERRIQSGLTTLEVALNERVAEAEQKVLSTLDKKEAHLDLRLRLMESEVEGLGAIARARSTLPAVQAPSLNPCGCFEPGRAYNRMDIVEAGGSSYICTKDGTRSKPTRRGEGWMLLAAAGAAGRGGVILGGNSGLTIVSEDENSVTLQG